MQKVQVDDIQLLLDQYLIPVLTTCVMDYVYFDYKIIENEKKRLYTAERLSLWNSPERYEMPEYKFLYDNITDADENEYKDRDLYLSNHVLADVIKHYFNNNKEIAGWGIYDDMEAEDILNLHKTHAKHKIDSTNKKLIFERCTKSYGKVCLAVPNNNNNTTTDNIENGNTEDKYYTELVANPYPSEIVYHDPITNKIFIRKNETWKNGTGNIIGPSNIDNPQCETPLNILYWNPESMFEFINKFNYDPADHVISYITCSKENVNFDTVSNLLKLGSNIYNLSSHFTRSLFSHPNGPKLMAYLCESFGFDVLHSIPEYYVYKPYRTEKKHRCDGSVLDALIDFHDDQENIYIIKTLIYLFQNDCIDFTKIDFHILYKTIKADYQYMYGANLKSTGDVYDLYDNWDSNIHSSAVTKTPNEYKNDIENGTVIVLSWFGPHFHNRWFVFYEKTHAEFYNLVEKKYTEYCAKNI